MWFKDIKKGNTEILRYRFTRVIFGVAPSQFLLNAVIRKHVAEYDDKEFEERVRKAFYVDDLAVSVENANKGINFYRKCKIRLSEGGFNLRKFRTNNVEVKRVLDVNEVKFDFDEKGKVLGINWDEVGDLLIIRFEDTLKKVPCS